MELEHIDVAKLCISAANMRAKGKADLSHILPSIRARGVLVPLIVRPTEEAERFEIVAGKRRYHAALVVAEESGEPGSSNCLAGCHSPDLISQTFWLPVMVTFTVPVAVAPSESATTYETISLPGQSETISIAVMKISSKFRWSIEPATDWGS
ncbi:ParB/RepB/Spo0J family partition protein [Sphingomonas kyeonggiensis]|uniref:ParB-like N-terminal domain-containing protein n=1 Tax=Sphingomonas kyeonggiensis TaxID=1268553 RepID=A0A7W6JUU1_9SPHN|nr:hypothetical protein [Sphingomonas kyeonggiensis]